MARSFEQRGHHVTCALIGTRHKLAAYNYTISLAISTTVEYELVDANEVCQGIQKVRVEPATRSAVATCIILHYITRHNFSPTRSVIYITRHNFSPTRSVNTLTNGLPQLKLSLQIHSLIHSYKTRLFILDVLYCHQLHWRIQGYFVAFGRTTQNNIIPTNYRRLRIDT